MLPEVPGKDDFSMVWVSLDPASADHNRVPFKGVRYIISPCSNPHDTRVLLLEETSSPFWPFSLYKANLHPVRLNIS